jgi:hypothetical protein
VLICECLSKAVAGCCYSTLQQQCQLAQERLPEAATLLLQAAGKPIWQQKAGNTHTCLLLPLHELQLACYHGALPYHTGWQLQNIAAGTTQVKMYRVVLLAAAAPPPAAADLQLVCCQLLQLLPACRQALFSDAVLPVQQRHNSWDALQVLLLQQGLKEAAQLVHAQPAQLKGVQPAMAEVYVRM